MIRISTRTRAAHDAQDPLSPVFISQPAPVHETPEMVGKALCLRSLQPRGPARDADRRGESGFYEGLIRITDTGGRCCPARVFHPLVRKRALGRLVRGHRRGRALSLGFRSPGPQCPGGCGPLDQRLRPVPCDSAWRRALSDSLRGRRLRGRNGLDSSRSPNAPPCCVPEVVARFMAEMQPVRHRLSRSDGFRGAASPPSLTPARLSLRSRQVRPAHLHRIRLPDRTPTTRRSPSLAFWPSPISSTCSPRRPGRRRRAADAGGVVF